MLLVGKQSFTIGASMNPFESAVVFVAMIAICGSEISAETPPTEGKAKLAVSTNSIGMKFKLISAGDFLMGSPQTEEGRQDNESQHRVRITKPFNMGVHEVTQAQCQKVMGTNLSLFKGADNPVNKVSWLEAVTFCRKLSELPAEKAAGNVYRLPTEAEWAYACRAGTTTKFSFGDDDSDLGDFAWYVENSANKTHPVKTHPVGSKQPNAWGLYDMHGNVWEWCQDRYGDYPNASVTDPTGPLAGSLNHRGKSTRVIRGGSFLHDAEFCRSAYRSGFESSRRYFNVGFRVCLSPSGK